MAKVHIVLINGGVMIVVDSKEKVVAAMKAAMCDIDEVTIEEDDEEKIITVAQLVEMMYDAGSTGDSITVTSQEMLEMGDDYAELSAHERDVE